MTPADFVAKWSKIQQKETAVYASHFDDVCRLVGHATPTEYAAQRDPQGRDFSFQTTTVKAGGQKGFADVYFRKRFIWEYKGLHADLKKAYQQLQLYREALDNPPLLITSDIHTIHIHSNFTNRPAVETVVTLADIAAGPGVAVLRRVFFDPASFQPAETRENITQATADTFLAVAEALKQHQRLTGEAYTPEQRAHFLIRLLFCLFSEDLGLLPDGVFSQLVKSQGRTYHDLRGPLQGLFRAMRDGGHFGWHVIRHFDGTLFDDDFVPTLPYDLAGLVMRAAEQDWSAVDPSIFGTLFERVIDEDKRAQLGAHYTSRADIALIVEPVLMEPLRREWDEVRRRVEGELSRGAGEQGSGGAEAQGSADAPPPSSPLPPSPPAPLPAFAAKLASLRVLDPACGSGNFLYVALRRLLDLQKEVIAYAARKGLPKIELTVGPEQLYGIEINEYAHELAQVTAWIGYLQWRHENGFAEMSDPVLRPLRNIQRMDAILAHDADGRPVEPAWPAAEVIIGNPPFLGGHKLRSELGNARTDDLYRLYEGKVPGPADLVCYWFERARNQIANGLAQRAGLIATNSIRGGANRQVLEKIKETGDIFMAWSDNPWVLDGAAVRVSIIGFDNGEQPRKTLDGTSVAAINSDLTGSIDLTKAIRLPENFGIAYSGTKKGGPFEIPRDQALAFMQLQNHESTKINRDVIKPWMNGREIIGRPQNLWIVDFGNRSEGEASEYQAPFEYVKKHVLPIRSQNRRAVRRDRWWLHSELAPALRKGLSNLSRFIATPRVAKHRIFVWAHKDTVPDDGTYAFVRDDDYFFGVLHARPHELWALRMGTSLEDRPRYTPTTTFETYPFPWPPGQEPAEADDPRVAAIAHWARRLVAWREAWLNPPPAEADYLGKERLKARTLTNLYNGLVYYRSTRPDRSGRPVRSWDRAEFDKETRKSVGPDDARELDDIHRALDAAVLRAYGWPDDLSDEGMLERLLALNHARAGRTGA